MSETVDVWYVYEELVRERDEFVLVDCRPEGERALATIDGALFHSREAIEANPEALDRSKDLVLFCHHGDVSALVAAFLSDKGFRSVTSMEGGIHAYGEQVDSDIPTY